MPKHIIYLLRNCICLLLKFQPSPLTGKHFYRVDCVAICLRGSCLNTTNRERLEDYSPGETKLKTVFPRQRLLISNLFRTLEKLLDYFEARFGQQTCRCGLLRENLKFPIQLSSQQAGTPTISARFLAGGGAST